MNGLNANLAAAKKALAGAQAGVTGSTNKITAIGKSLPALIKEAHAKADAVSKQVAGDKELAEAAAKLKAAVDNRTAANAAEQKTWLRIRQQSKIISRRLLSTRHKSSRQQMQSMRPKPK